MANSTTSAADWAFGDTVEQMQNSFDFHIRNMYASLPVRVDAVRSEGIVPVGHLDCTPLVSQVNASGQTMPYPKLVNVPYFRLQGGTNAVVIDPKVGDIGIAVFASRDISGAKRARGEAVVGSVRRFDLSDAMYIGGIMNSTPVQWIHFRDDGIVIHSPTKVRVEAPTAEVQCTTCTVQSATTSVTGSSGVTITSPQITLQSPHTRITGSLTMTGGEGTGAELRGDLHVRNGDVFADDISLKHHIHGSVERGAGKTDESEMA